MNLFSHPHTIGPCDTCGAFPSLLPVRSFNTRRSIAVRWNVHHRAQAAVKGFASLQPRQDIQEAANPVLPPVPFLDGKKIRAWYNPTALAFLGDSIWELYVRRHYFFPPSRIKQYYEVVTSQVRAETQESHYELLLAGDVITEEEREVLAWGCNAKVHVPPRFKNSGKHKLTYKHATAMEVLAGYLYLTDPQRLHYLMTHLGLGAEAPPDADGKQHESNREQAC